VDPLYGTDFVFRVVSFDSARARLIRVLFILIDAYYVCMCALSRALYIILKTNRVSRLIDVIVCPKSETLLKRLKQIEAFDSNTLSVFSECTNPFINTKHFINTLKTFFKNTFKSVWLEQARIIDRSGDELVEKPRK
jgi:hypothetical protein